MFNTKILKDGVVVSEDVNFQKSVLFQKMIKNLELIKECDDMFHKMKVQQIRNVVADDGTKYGKFENSDVFMARFTDGGFYIKFEDCIRSLSLSDGTSYSVNINGICSIKLPDGTTYMLYDDMFLIDSYNLGI